jgi:hypothetical protein
MTVKAMIMMTDDPQDPKHCQKWLHLFRNGSFIPDEFSSRLNSSRTENGLEKWKKVKHFSFLYNILQKTKAARSSETSVSYRNTKRRHNLEYFDLKRKVILVLN